MSSALTYSVQCPGVMPEIGIRAHLAACVSRDETSPGPAVQYNHQVSRSSPRSQSRKEMWLTGEKVAVVTELLN